jgi:hypothetical protein
MIDPLRTVRQRLITQGLAGEPFDDVAGAVRWLGAMQAQEFAEAKWSLAERTRTCTDGDVEAAFARGDIIRTHVLRPTWHFVARDDLRWLLRLTSPRVHALNRYWYRKFEIDAAVFNRAHAVFERYLADGVTRTRPELVEGLTAAGIEAAGSRLAYLLMHAELEEIICSGPRRGAQHTYTLVDSRVPTSASDDRSEESATDELVLRYFRSHGPATVKDFTAWSSFTVADSRASLERTGAWLTREEDAEGKSWYSGRAALPFQDEGSARLTGAFLIPMYDETVVAYQDLRVVLASSPARQDSIERAIVIDGRTFGSWKRTVTRTSVTVTATLFGPLAPAEFEALKETVERIGRFLGLAATLEVLSAY